MRGLCVAPTHEWSYTERAVRNVRQRSFSESRGVLCILVLLLFSVEIAVAQDEYAPLTSSD
jgi:hypothetical protein